MREKHWITGVVIVLVIAVVACILILVFGQKEEKVVAPQPATGLVQVSAPAPQPAPPRPLPTKAQVAPCVEQALKDNHLDAHTARRIQIGQSVALPGGVRKAAAGDNLWTMCRVALTDPVSVRYYAARTELAKQAQQLAENERNVAMAQAVVTEKARERDKTLLEIAATQRQLASIQTELNMRRDYEIAERRMEREASRLSFPRPASQGASAAP